VWRPVLALATALFAAASIIPTVRDTEPTLDREISPYTVPFTGPISRLAGLDSPAEPTATLARSRTASPTRRPITDEPTLPPTTVATTETAAKSTTTTVAHTLLATTTTAISTTAPTPTTATASAVAPGELEGLLGGRMGFGGNVTGGAGGDICVVSSLADSGPGSLRECVEGGGTTWIRFGVSGEIRLGSELEVGSNKTIDGRDSSITIRGEVELSGVSNVVIHNIAITGSPEDAIQIKAGSSNVWLDHLSLSNSGDGLIDITQGSTNVTVSWTRFSNHDKVMLLGIDGDDSRPPQVTIHHCFFDGTGQRHPRLRFGKVHMFNNYLAGWIHYGVASSDGGQTLSEANIYQAGSDTRAVLTHMGDDAQEGTVRSVGDLTLNGAIINQRAPETVFTPPYGYNPEPASTTLATTIAATAGSN
jgi:pectate lyase